MREATFLLKHEESDSRVFVECRRVKGKVRITDVGFARGNVVSLVSVRNVVARAKEILY